MPARFGILRLPPRAPHLRPEPRSVNNRQFANAFSVGNKGSVVPRVVASSNPGLQLADAFSVETETDASASRGNGRFSFETAGRFQRPDGTDVSASRLK